MKVLIVIAAFVAVAHAQSPHGQRIDICTNQADGSFYKDFTDCKRYIACVGGRSLHGSCPDQLLFNSTRSSCDYSSRVQCNSCPRSGTKTFAVEGSCRRYVRCASGQAEYLECGGELFFNPLTGQCGQQADVECVERICQSNGDYLVASKEDCSVYYQCSRGAAKRVECRAGLYYNAAKQDCDARENVQCTIAPPRPAELSDVSVACPARGEFSFPHPADCGHYYLCMNGVSAMLSCGPALRYDVLTKECVLPERAQCITRFK